MSKRPKKSSNVRKRRWSAKVAKRSNALDIERDVFKSKDPHKIAVSLNQSAERSTRRKRTPYQSAMSMLNFYINRAGRNLPKQKRVLEHAKTNYAMFSAERNYWTIRDAVARRFYPSG